MKKSKIYHIAALAVMNDKYMSLTSDERLEAIQQLMEAEKLALFVEGEEESK